MPIALGPAGLEISTLEELRSDITDGIHATISPTLNLSDTSALGQKIGITASQLRQIHEAVQAVYSSMDPDQATGASLDRIGAYTGSTRRPATSSVARMTITLAAGSYAAGTLVVNVVGDVTKRFSNISAITTLGGTLVNVPFAADQTGPIEALAGTLTQISNPIVGFSNPTNPTDATVGEAVESDAQFRRRRELELARKGSTTVDAIRADLLAVEDDVGEPMFDFVSVIENDQDVTDGDGRPPHSFETLVVSDASAEEIAAEILLVKPAGIRAYGLTVESVPDSQGNPHSIGFTTPTVIDVAISVELDAIPGLYAGDVAVQDAILEYAALNFSVGNDIIHAQIVSLVMGVPGVVDCEVLLTEDGGPYLEQNLVIGPREIGVVTRSLIDVDSSDVGGPP